MITLTIEQIGNDLPPAGTGDRGTSSSSGVSVTISSAAVLAAYSIR